MEKILTVLFLFVGLIYPICPQTKTEHADEEKLMLAVKNGEIDQVVDYLKAGQNVNYQDDEGITPLYWAVRNGNLFLANLLLKNRASIKAVTKNGYTILHAASFSGLIAVVRQCLEKKIDVNVRDNWCGWTPLHLASKQGKTSIIKLLLLAGADINNQDHFGFTPLHLAAMTNRLQVGKLLIDNRADINSRDQNEQTPLHLSAKWKQLDFVRLLIEQKAEIDPTDKYGFTPLLLSAQQGQEEMVELMIANHANPGLKTKNGSTLLHAAISGGLLNLVRKCLEWDLDINAKEQGGWSPLHTASESGQRMIAELLINKGAVINTETWQDIIRNHRLFPRGTTPLSIAKILNNDSVVELLKKYMIEE